MKNYRYLQRKYLVNTYPDRGKLFIRGEGVYLYDEKGDRYLDMMSNYGVNLFGYNHPELTSALAGQLSTLTTLHNSFNNDIRGAAASRLIQRCGGHLSQVYLSNSGAEAIEAALKFAVLATGNKRFVSCRQGYHGKTLGALSASSTAKYIQPFQPLLWEFEHIDFGDADQLETVLDGSQAGFLLEPIQGESGVFVPEQGYLKRVRQICTHANVPLLMDEIQTGLGRTGDFLAIQSEGVEPDILCLGKGLAGGIPVGATLVTAEIAKFISRSVHTSTFGGNPLACAGILATLDLLDTGQLDHVQEVGSTFMKRLSGLDSELIHEVRGRGLMLGIEVPGKQSQILKALQSEGILAAPAGTDVVRFLPPLIIDPGHVDRAVVTLQDILTGLD